jgi:dTDP-4-dehydrorhamnose reductase
VRIALTGSNGMLGHDIKKVFKDIELAALTRKDLDITSLDQSVSRIKDISPDYLIHSAAYTDVDGCEQDPEKAYRVNGIGTRNLTIACEEVKCPILYISSDYVFDGAGKEPYKEWDQPGPVTRYGRSKLMGEQYVNSFTTRFYIVRTSWLYGKHGKNFVDTICRLLSEKDEIDVVDDQVGSPTYTYDLALTLRELIGKGYGMYHITNSSHCSWFEFAQEIASLKSSKTRIVPTTTDKFNRPAKRPAYSVLDNTLLRLEGIGELRHWKDALREYLST